MFSQDLSTLVYQPPILSGIPDTNKLSYPREVENLNAWLRRPIAYITQQYVPSRRTEPHTNPPVLWTIRYCACHPHEARLYPSVSAVALDVWEKGKERLAMDHFFETTGGHQWYHNEGWMDRNGELRNRFGIAVEDGHVTKIHLPENNLSGKNDRQQRANIYYEEGIFTSYFLSTESRNTNVVYHNSMFESSCRTWHMHLY